MPRIVPVASVDMLQRKLEADINVRAKAIAEALAEQVSKEIEDVSKRKVIPQSKVSVEAEKHVARIFVSSKNKEVALEARKEEFMGSRPFAQVFTKINSKAAVKDMLKDKGIQ
jgi:ribosome-binding factor A